MTDAVAPTLHPITQSELDEVVRLHGLYLAAVPGGKRATLAQYNLSHLKLAGTNLAQADLYGACLHGADLTQSNLESVNLFGADLRAAKLAKAILAKADLRGSLLRGANLNGADLTEADLREGRRAERDSSGDLKAVEFAALPADGSQATMQAANLTGARMNGFIALQTDFSGATLKNAVLTRASLRGAKFLQADLSGADLREADLRQCNFTGALMQATRLENANTDGAQLAQAVSNAPQGIQLKELERPFEFMLRDHRRWVDTHGAEGAALDLSGVDLRPLVSLSSARLSALKAEKAFFTGLDLFAVELQAAQLSGADLRDCHLHRADMRGARALIADFSGANMAEADISPLQMANGHKLAADFCSRVCATPIWLTPSLVALICVRQI